MGTQSITHPPRTTHGPLRIALLLLLSIACSRAPLAQTSSLTTPLLLPSAIVFDSAGNLYFAETANHVIRKLDTAGQITTIAGTIGTQGFSGDAGPATSATLDSPQGLALDSSNNLYIADTHNHRIRKLNLTTGTLTTIAGTGTPGFSGDGSAATASQLNLPTALALDTTGTLYLADTTNHRIRKISTTGIIITTIAGDGTQSFSGDGGPAINASLDSPRNTALTSSTLVTLSDTGNQRIRQLTAAPSPSTTIQTIAGLGLTTSEALTLTAPSVISYGTGQLTATLTSTTPATGTITFFDNATTTLGTATLTSNIATLATTTLSAGQHYLTAIYSGDPNHAATQSSPLVLTVTPQQLTAAINPITLLYGQPIPAIFGALTGILPQDASKLSATFTTTANTLSPTGTYPITAILAGPAAGNYTLASTAATLTINPAPTITTLTATSGSSITLTAHVTSTTVGTPTGSITFLDTGTPLFTSPISSGGDLVFTINSPTQGSHSLTAFYSGSANFNPSTSTAQLITIGTRPTNPDFTLTPTGTSTQTILSGSSASYTFTVQLQGNMSSPISLAATGLPNLATASFNPPILPPGSTTNTFTLTIATPNTTAKNPNPIHTRTEIVWAFLLLPVATLLPRSNRRITTKLLTLTLLVFTLSQITGCGNRISPADSLTLSAKPYTITVTGTATTPTGSLLQHSTSITLILEQAQ
jgi:sugar lactone lactonase YvrE